MNCILQKIKNSFIIVLRLKINGDDFVDATWLDVVKAFVSNDTNIWLIITIFLIAYIGISKKKGAFCSSKSKESCESRKDKEECIKLVQKDYTYLIVIVLIVSIFLISLSLYTNEDAISLFSFASTIASIILSVIAIILTITSETKNASMKDKLEKSAEQIKKTTEMLKIVSDNIKPELLHDIGNKIASLDELMKEAITKIEEAIENTEATRNALEQKIFAGNPEFIETNIPIELEGGSISFNKYSQKEDGKNA